MYSASWPLHHLVNSVVPIARNPPSVDANSPPLPLAQAFLQIFSASYLGPEELTNFGLSPVTLLLLICPLLVGHFRLPEVDGCPSVGSSLNVPPSASAQAPRHQVQQGQISLSLATLWWHFAWTYLSLVKAARAKSFGSKSLKWVG